MKGVDTDVLLRLLVKDDARQHRSALELFEKHFTATDSAYVNRIVLCELVWTLSRGYGYDRNQVAGVVDRLLSVEAIVVEDAALVRGALESYRAGSDFADALLAASNSSAGCISTITFDAAAARRVPGFELISR